MSSGARSVTLPISLESFELVLPRATDERMGLALTKIIERRTNGRIRDLRVEVVDQTVRIRGRCTTFYAKQLAQHAAMDVVHGVTIVNEIHVAAFLVAARSR